MFVFGKRSFFIAVRTPILSNKKSVDNLSIVNAFTIQSGWLESNQRPHAPQTRTLTGLSYTPNCECKSSVLFLSLQGVADENLLFIGNNLAWGANFVRLRQRKCAKIGCPSSFFYNAFPQWKRGRTGSGNALLYMCHGFYSFENYLYPINFY